MTGGRADRHPADRDGGSVLVLGVGAVAVVLALLLVCVDVASLALRRHEAVLVADTAARAAAQALDVGAYYTGDATGRLPLDSAQARSRAERVVPESWRLESVTVRTGEVSVTVRGRVSFGFGGHVGLPATEVTATAVAVLRRD